MAGDVARDPSEGPPEATDRPQDAIVDRLRPDPAQPPDATLTLTGFLGDSDRPGFRRLYFSRDLDYYAEFRTEDVVHVASIPPEVEPFRGDEATRVMLRRAALVEYTWTRNARPLDDFDVDVRFGRPTSISRSRRIFTDSCEHGCGPSGECDFVTPGTCQDTCETCLTSCGTCETCIDWPGCEPLVRRRG
jgi:hypothetical protein